MSTPVLPVGLLLAALGAGCAAFPAALVTLVSRLVGKWWVLLAGAAIRVGLGGTLVLAAEWKLPSHRVSPVWGSSSSRRGG